MAKQTSESCKRRLYHTFSKLGIISVPVSFEDNIYIDDKGFVMIVLPDGVVNAVGKLSFSGEFICKTD